ncbi:hypothetical protein OAN21_00960 [Alphaproteobacteria bacterium]|nr:hypothetical protein [Alphaproteobacteria bacterium]
MLKRYFFILFLLIPFEALCKKEPLNLCKALTSPNSLLLDLFLKIDLRKRCAYGQTVPSLHKSSKKSTGCYYSIPKKWATSIDYQKLSKTGIILKSRKRRSCPLLTYKDFELLTFQGSIRLEEDLWETNQENHIKRLLRRELRIAPRNSPPVISPKKILLIEAHRGKKGIQIPIIMSKPYLPKGEKK